MPESSLLQIKSESIEYSYMPAPKSHNQGMNPPSIYAFFEKQRRKTWNFEMQDPKSENGSLDLFNKHYSYYSIKSWEENLCNCLPETVGEKKSVTQIP